MFFSCSAPIGYSLSISLLKEMGRRDAKKGVASLCVGGGMGAAILYERA